MKSSFTYKKYNYIVTTNKQKDILYLIIQSTHGSSILVKLCILVIEKNLIKKWKSMGWKWES